MPRKNPIGLIKDTADSVVSTAVSTAVGTGQQVAGHVIGTAVSAAGVVASKIPGRSKPSRAERPTPPAVPQDAALKVHGDPVSAAPPAKKAPAKKAPAAATAKKATAKKAVKKAPAKKLASAGKPEIPTPDETALAKKAAGSDD